MTMNVIRFGRVWQLQQVIKIYASRIYLKFLNEGVTNNHGI